MPATGAPGRVVGAPAGDERGRTSSFGGRGLAEGAVTVLPADGRIFRFVPRGAGYELCGWEMPGAYLVLRPDGADFKIFESAAGVGLEEMDLLTLLSAATLFFEGEPCAHPGGCNANE